MMGGGAQDGAEQAAGQEGLSTAGVAAAAPNGKWEEAGTATEQQATTSKSACGVVRSVAPSGLMMCFGLQAGPVLFALCSSHCAATHCSWIPLGGWGKTCNVRGTRMAAANHACTAEIQPNPYRGE